MDLPKQIIYALKKIMDDGGKAYLVGGAVRDLILKRDIPDYDISSSLSPSRIEALFSDHKSYKLGKSFGTIGVIIDSIPIEITTMRSEGAYSDKRHPDKVYFIDDIVSDLARRDFTINAMAYNPLTSTDLVDPFRGRADLEAGIIRSVANARHRFEEDPLRILRALRFASQLSFRLEANTYKAILESYQLLSLISKERINDEFTKLLLSPRPDLGLRLAQETKLIDIILPFKTNRGLSRASLEIIRLSKAELPLRLAALIYYLVMDDATDMVEKLASLRYPKALISQVKRLVGGYLILKDMDESPYAMRRLLVFTGRQTAKQLLSWYMHEAYVNKNMNTRARYEKLYGLMIRVVEDNDPIDLKDLAISGKDVLAAGIGSDRPELVGLALDLAHELVLKNPKMNDKDLLIKSLISKFK